LLTMLQYSIATVRLENGQFGTSEPTGVRAVGHRLLTTKRLLPWAAKYHNSKIKQDTQGGIKLTPCPIELR
jgi:hypothetical protein